MKCFFRYITIFFLATVLLSACDKESLHKTDQLALRVHVDRYNRDAFLNRYNDPNCAIHESLEAIELMRDSLPDYYEGQMRAYNNLAFAYYMIAKHDIADQYIDSVLSIADNPLNKSPNKEIETVIAKLLEIRLLQRSCRIADSYDMLYKLQRSSILKHNPDSYLYSFAQMEYYITSLTLNYHYRNSAISSSSSTMLKSSTVEEIHAMLNEIEDARTNLRCDYAEDISLNYAMAHSYYRLASAMGSNAEMLSKAYDYLAKNLEILSIPNQQCAYHLANVFQLQAFIVADTSISPVTYQKRCRHKLQQLDNLSRNLYPADSLYLMGDYGLDMFRISTDLFFQTPDPYQHLGAVVAAAEYCLRINDYDEAFRYYNLGLQDTTWCDGMAPKFESMLYDGLIRSGFSSSPKVNTEWYKREVELLSFIRQNESKDAKLQDQLTQSESRNHFYGAALVTILVSLVVMSILVVLLRHRTRRLQVETEALQLAKKQDIERIANVESCLSVMRHDVNPFLSYLQNKKLSPEMRQEVLDQLIRTFTNIKYWTNLSIPSGLQFQPSVFPIDEVFHAVESTCINVHEHVTIRFSPTPLTVWGDRQLVEIMLRNLVNNALQHTQQGSVTVSAMPHDDDPRFVHITVTDTGSGMDEETMENLFRADKKVRTDTDPNAPHGTGFGLILCKYIIKRHDDNTLRGCRIWAESTLGKGTTMHIILTANDQKQ